MHEWPLLSNTSVIVHYQLIIAVIAPAQVKHQWAKEIRKWLPSITENIPQAVIQRVTIDSGTQKILDKTICCFYLLGFHTWNRSACLGA